MAMTAENLRGPLCFAIDLKSGLIQQPIRSQLMKGDKSANTVIVELTEDKKEVDLSGVTVTGSFISPVESAEIQMMGRVDGNKAIVTLIDECYAEDGYFECHIKLTVGETSRTILSFTGHVLSKGSGAVIDIGQVIPSIDAIIAQYDEMKRVTQRATDAAEYAESLAINAEGYSANTEKLGGIPAGDYMLRKSAEKNLIINGNFENPVNRRGKTVYPYGYEKETIDGWKTGNRVEVFDGYVTVSNEGDIARNFAQYFSAGTIKLETDYTIVLMLMSGKICIGSGRLEDGEDYKTFDAEGMDVNMGLGRDEKDYIFVKIDAGVSHNIKWIELYEGAYTVDDRPPHIPRGYAQELATCRLMNPELDRVTIYPLISKRTQDCILIRAYDENILCDTGSVSVEEDPDAPRVLFEKMQALGVTRVDRVIISHYHYDHTGVHEMIAAGLDVNGAQLILPPNIPENAIETLEGVYAQQMAILNMAQEQNMNIVQPAENEKIWIGGEGSHFEFYNVDHSAYYADLENFDYNNCSMCTMLVHGEQKVFFSSDIAIEAQNAMRGRVPAVDLYKVEHHGLNAIFDKEWYMTVTPRIAFTTDGGPEEETRRGYLPVLSKSASHRYLQSMGVPNYCTHDNPDLRFVITKNHIAAYGRSFSGRVLLEGRPSLMSAIPYDYTESSKNITLMDLIKCMEHETYVTTRINDDYALWDLVGDFVGNTATSAILTLFKGSSVGYTASSDKYTGLIQITPMPKSTMKGLPVTGMIVGTFDVKPDDSALSVNLRQIVPVQYYKFTKTGSVSPSIFNESEYNGSLFTLGDSGYIQSNFDGIIKYSVTVWNKSDAEKTLTICKQNSSGVVTNLVSNIVCGAQGSICVTNMYTCGSGDVFYIKSSDDSLEDVTIWFICEGASENQKHMEYTDASMTTSPIFVNHPYY